MRPPNGCKAAAAFQLGWYGIIRKYVAGVAESTEILIAASAITTKDLAKALINVSEHSHSSLSYHVTQRLGTTATLAPVWTFLPQRLYRCGITSTLIRVVSQAFQQAVENFHPARVVDSHLAIRMVNRKGTADQLAYGLFQAQRIWVLD